MYLHKITMGLPNILGKRLIIENCKSIRTLSSVLHRPTNRNLLLNSTKTDLVHFPHCNVNFNLCGKSNFSSFILSLFKKKSMEQHKISDGIPLHYELVMKSFCSMIYCGNLILFQQLSIVASILCSLAELTGLYDFNIFNYFSNNMAGCIILGFHYFLMLVGTYRIYTWYPLKIYYSENDENYLAVMLSLIPFKTRILQIKEGSAKAPKTNFIVHLFLQSNDNFVANVPNGRIYLNHYNFVRPIYYNKLFGYTKLY